MDEWINKDEKKRWYSHIIEYNSDVKRKEIVSHSTAWMNLENFMLSEISQSLKDKYCIISLL